MPWFSLLPASLPSCPDSCSGLICVSASSRQFILHINTSFKSSDHTKLKPGLLPRKGRYPQNLSHKPVARIKGGEGCRTPGINAWHQMTNSNVFAVPVGSPAVAVSHSSESLQGLPAAYHLIRWSPLSQLPQPLFSKFNPFKLLLSNIFFALAVVCPGLEVINLRSGPGLECPSPLLSLKPMVGQGIATLQASGLSTGEQLVGGLHATLAEASAKHPQPA